MGEEVELKLVGSEDVVSGLMAGLLSGSSRKQQLDAVYFDTPDHRLWQHGTTLRIRREGRSRIQTVKTGNARGAGVLSRGEWERPVDTDEPVIDPDSPVHGLLTDFRQPLRPCFKVEMDRRIWTFTENSSRIEVALDRGAIVAGERNSALVELELELKAGAAVDLFSLARQFMGGAALSLGTPSKAERGFRLLSAAPAAFKAEPIPLEPDTPGSATFQMIASSCLRQYLLNADLLRLGPSVEALHQARVALRRLRSAMAIFRPMVADVHYERLNSELRALAAVLGEARDLDVLIERCEDDGLRALLGKASNVAQKKVGRTLRSAGARILALDAAEWLVCGAWTALPETMALRDQSTIKWASRILDRFHRRLKKKTRNLVDLEDAARHEARKDAKKLRYATEFFATIFEGHGARRRQARYLDTLEELQDELGALNDIASARHLLDSLGLAGASRARLARLGDKAALLVRAADARDDLVASKRFWGA